MSIDITDSQLLVMAFMKQEVIVIVDVVCAVVAASIGGGVRKDQGVGGIFEVGAFGIVSQIAVHSIASHVASVVACPL